MYPGQAKFLIEAFRDATQEPYTYMLVDLKPDTDEKFRVRTNIFPANSATSTSLNKRVNRDANN